MSASVSETSPQGARQASFTLSLNEMIRRYETCVRIREISKQQLMLSDDMALIAINAEIAAAKSTANQDAFMILANETGKIARQMSEHVAQVLDGAEDLARRALTGVVKARRLAKFQAGLARIRHPENAKRLEEVAWELDASLADLMEGIRKSQVDIETTRQALDKLHQRFSRIITYFRIEASRDAEHGAFFENIADDLYGLIVQAQTISGGLHAILKEP